MGPLLEEGLLDAPDPAASFTAPAPLDPDALRFVVVDGVLRETPELPDGLELRMTAVAVPGSYKEGS